MSRELGEVVDALSAGRLLAPEDAARLARVARRELVSLRSGLRFLLTCGVLLFAGGAGLLVKENAARIGPLAVGALIALLAAGCLAFAFRALPPFTWGEAPARGALCEAALLLGALLFASDLAFLESQLALLGSAWPYHLFAVALVYAALAYRADSRPLLSMALTSFAAWRGLSRDVPLDVLFRGGTAAFRLNAFLCAGLFALGAWHAGTGRKRHFEPVYSNFAILLLLCGLGAGTFTSEALWPAWDLLLTACGAAIAFAGRKRRRPLWLAQGAVAAWLGVCRAVFAIFPEAPAFLLAGMLSLAFFVLLVRETRALKEPA